MASSPIQIQLRPEKTKAASVGGLIHLSRLTLLRLEADLRHLRVFFLHLSAGIRSIALALCRSAQPLSVSKFSDRVARFGHANYFIAARNELSRAVVLSQLLMPFETKRRLVFL
jgi:hypothetical protein